MRWTQEQYQEYLKKNNKEIIDTPAKKSKYSNRKTEVDGIRFDSQKEADYYCQLKLLKQAGEIKDFGMQQRYELLPTFKKNGMTFRSVTYVADFVIVNNDGTTEVVDVKASKNFKTDVYKIKRKLFEHKYPDLTIKEVY